MSMTHLHLLLNHVPVLGTVFGVALFAFGFWRRSQQLSRAGLTVFLISALIAVPVYFTGENAESAVKPLPGFSKTIAEEHEEIAAKAFVGILALGVAALAGLILFRGARTIPPWFGTIILFTSLIVSGLMLWTAGTGGQVRHTEIRSESSPAPAPLVHHD
jgi:hypothetical protein